MHMFSKTIKYLFIFLVVYIVLNAITPFIPYLQSRSIENQISYLKERIEKGEDDNQQLYYPEGKLFSNAILLLSIIEWESKKVKVNQSNIEFIDKTIIKLLSQETRENFHEFMEPKYGAFYLGWTNFVMKKFIDSGIFRFSNNKEYILTQHKDLSDTIVKAFMNRNINDTYQGGAWPADNLVCVASINDSVIIRNWTNFIINYSKGNNDMFPHKFSETLESRGSSMALMTYFINHFDKELAEKQNVALSKHFLCRKLGINFIKENKEGNFSDVDSGPVFFNIGSVATIMNIKTQNELKKPNQILTWASLNIAGLPINLFGQKYYLFKKVFMFDVFMLWTSIDLQ